MIVEGEVAGNLSTLTTATSPVARTLLEARDGADLPGLQAGVLLLCLVPALLVIALIVFCRQSSTSNLSVPL